MSRGFTIIELMVALFIFTLIGAGAANLLLTATASQRDSLTTQEVLSKTSTLGEYMSRALRGAKKELNIPPQNCLTTIGRGYNYELNAERIRFLNRENLCQEFYLSGTEILERKSTDDKAQNFGQAVALTSSDVNVLALRFSLLGEGQQDSLQPRATVYFQVQSQGSKPEAQNIIHFQTTISQRNFDVEK
ncbi:MAG: prepilin-type N-terminal cleavage/methylation domain-containing protein [Candidatus Wildermuthbacteria bacterium]|nr:prepilin-type N-terminal cleavage/methylation domain-containing protein [Candidatus Wildermuthbacteria bacterium]